jgi:hypothetical protein
MSRLFLFCLTLSGLAALALFVGGGWGSRPLPSQAERGEELELSLLPDAEDALDAGPSIEGESHAIEAGFRRESGATDEQRPERRQVEASSETDAPPPALLPPEQEQGELRLRVLDPGGNPLPGTTVQVWVRPSGRVLQKAFEGRRGPREQRARMQLGKEQQLGKEHRTDKEGRLLLPLEAWPESVIEVLAVHERFAPTALRRSLELDAKLLAQTRAQDLVARQRGSKAGPSRVPLDFGDLRLEPGGKIVGQIVDKSGAPVADARLLIEPELRGRWDPHRRAFGALEEKRSDKLGHFALDGLPEGRLRFRIESDLHLPWRSDRLRIRKGNEISAGRIQLVRGAQLRGLVRDDRGRPIAQARLRILPRPSSAQNKQWQRLPGKKRQEASKEWRSVEGRPVETRSDAQGRFSVERLPHQSLLVEVRHPEHVTARKSPIDASKTPFLELEMERRLSLRGVVVDARTGGALERYGIKARRIGNPRPTPQQIAQQQLERTQKLAAERAKRAQQSAARARAREASAKKRPARPKSPQQIQREKQREERNRQRAQQTAQKRAQQRNEQQRRQQLQRARKQQEWAYYKQRIGGSGIMPRPVRNERAQPRGEFEIDKLEPGRYVLDISAKGYVPQAAGPFDIAKGRPTPQIRVRLEPGTTASGRISDAITGEALAGAVVELFLPHFQNQEDPRRSLNPLFAAMRPVSKGRKIKQAKTGQDGRFSFEGLRGGAFHLRVRRADYDREELDNLILSSGQDRSDLDFALTPGAELWGRVHGYEELKRGYVILATTSGQRRQLRIDAKTHEYRAKGLESGEYFVRLGEHGRKGGPFVALVEAVARPGANRPDIALRAGQTRRLDLDATKRSVGAVHGRVLVNGKPGRGLELELEPRADMLSNLGPNDPMGFVRRMVQRWSKDRCNNKGEYRIEPLPPGIYELSVTRRTRRERRVLWTQEVTVQGTRPARMDLALQLGDLEIQALRNKDGKPASLGITLVPAREAADLPPREWRKVAGRRSARIRGGKATLRELPAGEYRYVFYGGGYKAAEGRSYVGAAGSRLDLRVDAQPRRKKATNSSGAKPKPKQAKKPKAKTPKKAPKKPSQKK